MLNIVDQGILWRSAESGAYMPSMTRLGDGRLLACQHVGSGLGAADNALQTLHLTESGSWQATPVHAPDSRWSWRGPDIEELPDGKLLLTACRFENMDGGLFDPDSEALQRPENLIFGSSDGGKTWTLPEVLPIDLPEDRYTCNKAGRLLQFSPTRWMFPFETWKPHGHSGPPDQKAAAVFTNDGGATWDELTIIADDTTGRLLWWDQMNTQLADGRAYVMLWTHRYGTKEDLSVHVVWSDDEGRHWTSPQPTNLPGQVCCPVALPDGRVAAVYNHRHDPQGVRVALSDDLVTFDREKELTIFDAGAEATFGSTDHENFLAEHMLIAFGKPQGILDHDNTLLLFFWCTTQGVTHTRWVRVAYE